MAAAQRSRRVVTMAIVATATVLIAGLLTWELLFRGAPTVVRVPATVEFITSLQSERLAIGTSSIFGTVNLRDAHYTPLRDRKSPITSSPVYDGQTLDGHRLYVLSDSGGVMLRDDLSVITRHNFPDIMPGDCSVAIDGQLIAISSSDLSKMSFGGSTSLFELPSVQMINQFEDEALPHISRAGTETILTTVRYQPSTQSAVIIRRPPDWNVAATIDIGGVALCLEPIDDAGLIAVGTQEGHFLKVDLTTEKMVAKYRVSDHSIRAIEPIGPHVIAVGDSDNRVTLIDSSGKATTTLTPCWTGVGITCLHYAPESRRLAAGYWNSRVALWDLDIAGD